jgi:peptidoglycan/xylan/chitin deacetylase (PgdA/CDA1 family)
LAGVAIMCDKPVMTFRIFASTRPLPRLSRRAVIAGGAATLVPARARAALGTSRTLSIGAGGGLQIGLKTYPRTLDLADGEIVLTLDDGPLPGPTSRVLDVLKAEGVRASFFLIGRNAAASPELVRRMVGEGHTVAHHSQTHPWTLRRMPDEAARRDIEAGFRTVEQIAHGSAGGALRVPFFRYPGFADTPALNTWLAGQGVTVFGTDLWGSDWSPMSPERQLSLLMGRLNRARRGIVLLHDVVGQTAAMMPAFLAALRAGGYRIVHAQPGVLRPALREAPAGWTPETERIIATRR